jgi:tRNA-2-methylthio-N6-dimethylallyladenosine synthase
MRGCDNFCTFCVVPYTRGRERSRSPEDVLLEARDAAMKGYKQVTLLGQNVNSYRAGSWDFSRLMIAVADVPGIERVRFTSPHPKDFPASLLQAIAEHPHICKHIHLPLQAGSDRILNLMGRTYSSAEYLRLVDRIRQSVPDVVLTTDIICGFCSETEREFLETERMMEQVRYHAAFIFKYSERKNTIAARKLPDEVSESIKSDRVTRLVNFQRRISLERNREAIGHTVRILIEGDAKRSSDQGMGRTDGNLPVIWAKAAAPCTPGTFLERRIVDASATTLYS